MVDAARMLQKEPPRRPLDDVAAVVDDFWWRFKDRKLTDQVITWCAEAPTFNVAVQRAVESRDRHGKHHNHQSKVDIDARKKFGRRIVMRRREIKRIRLTDESEWYTHFDQLHEILDDIKPYGIGPVTVYDVAVRVGAYLGIEPKSVYLHAGVRNGVNALFNALGKPLPNGINRLPMYMFPEPLASLSADDVEDILCTYREVFSGWRKDGG